MECVRARGVFSSVRARQCQARCVMRSARRRTGCWSGPKLLFEADQTARFCAMRGRCVSHWLAIWARGNVENNLYPALTLECEVISSWPFFEQEEPLLKSGFPSHLRQDPVYVWSPVVSQCSKTCGNGKWNETHSSSIGNRISSLD